MTYETNAKSLGAISTIVGLFDNGSDAQKAVSELRASGLSANQIGAAFRSSTAGRLPHRYDEAARHTQQTASSQVKQTAENWWEKVKDAFRSDETVENRREVIAAADAGVVDPYGTDRYSSAENEYEYAGEDFERSLAQAGIPSQRAAYLSRNLRPDGAIVTVRDTDRTEEVEQILSRNHGKVRHEDTGFEAVDSTSA